MAKVLAVDDDPLILSVVSRLLEQAGHEVTSQRSSADAAELARRERFEVAIVDYEMPEPDGLELLRHLREVQPRALRILMSGKLELPVVLEAVNRGEVGRLIEKPFREGILVDTIADALEARKRIREVILGNEEDDIEGKRKMLDDCMADDTIQLALQPLIMAESAEVIAFEALMRSRHPVLSNPILVLTAAEATGQIHELAGVIAERAGDWVQRLPEKFSLFMNVHPAELASPEDMRKRAEQLAPWAPRIVLEITERTYLLEMAAWTDSVKMLVDMGFRIAVDDLGSGYNSLAVLAELQPQYIKIDMSIVRNVDKVPRKQRIFEMLSRFASATDAALVAEGVETEEEREALKACGAHILQGYLIGRPDLEPDIPG